MMVYENNNIVIGNTGSDFDELMQQLPEDERAFIYLRLITGDELSKRAKFAFICWVGPQTAVMKKARVATDKGVVKSVVQNFAVEIVEDDKNEIKYSNILELVKKAGGANYGTGK